MSDKIINVAQIVGKMNTGGVEMQMTNFYRAIDKSKVQFTFIYDADSTNVPIDELSKLGAKFIKVAPYQKMPQYLKDVYTAVKTNNFDIVHVNLNTMSVFPLMASFFAGAKIRILHNHSTAHKDEGKKAILKYILRPFCSIFLTHKFACSKLAGKFMYGEKNVNNGNVTIIHNAINTSRFSFNKEKRDTVRKSLNINQNSLVIGHVGRFVHQKNHEFLLDIFKEVLALRPDAKLILVGEGELLKQTREKALNLNINSNIYYEDFCNDVEKYYSAFDLFLLPSRFEGLPIVGVEAQCSGLPCVFSSEVTSETKMKDTSIFISLNDTPQTWAKEIIALANNSSERTPDDIINAGYDINDEASRLATIYEKLCEEN